MKTKADIPAFLALGVGALLLWAAIKGENPLTLLKDTLAGKPYVPRTTDPAGGGTKPMPPTATVPVAVVKPAPYVPPKPPTGGGTIAA